MRLVTTKGGAIGPRQYHQPHLTGEIHNPSEKPHAHQINHE